MHGCEDIFVVVVVGMVVEDVVGGFVGWGCACCELFKCSGAKWQWM